ncbi:MAG: tetratricopeptide repeat protein [Methylotenera sp.]|nr:tetratricopeptide repeat protein [Methylotenera sp.]MDP3304395.1 tetratricopeptide repeat protein [Methylotenera sp.]
MHNFARHQTTQTLLNRLLLKKASRIFPVALWMLVSAATLGVSGCAGKDHIKTATVTEPVEVRGEQTTVNKNELSAEFIYKYLVGEIAGQRGEIGTSGAIFYELAKTERDPRLAERAAKIAAFGNVPGLAVPAIKLWAELDADSTEAQQAATEMLIATGKLNEAEPYLAKLLSKEENRANGFLYLNGILGRSADKAGVLRLVQSLAKPYPDLAEAQFAIAQAAWVATQDTVALKALNNAEELHPGWHVAALLKGQVLYRQSPQVALDFYHEFLGNHPDANEVRINLAKLLVNQKQYDAAKKEYPVILEHAKYDNAKNIAEVNVIVGLLSFQSADYPSAEHYFKQALMQNFKESDQLYIYLGQTAEKQQHDADAIDWYKKVSADSRHLEAQISLANVIARTQSVDKAIELLDAVEDLNTEQQIVVIQTQAALLAKAKRNLDAFELLDKAVKNLPNTPDLVYDYALAAERLQKFDLMESELRRAIAEKPDFSAAYNALGYSFADRNIRLNEAIKLIEKALSFSPNDHYMLDSLGWAHYRKGNLNKAIKYLQQAYDINPDPEIAAHLGEALWQKGQYDQAKKIWAEALSAHPDNEVLISTANKFKS